MPVAPEMVVVLVCHLLHPPVLAMGKEPIVGPSILSRCSSSELAEVAALDTLAVKLAAG